METKTCKQCGKEFKTYACYKRVFCSKSCSASFRNHLRTKEKENRECPICHNLFTVTPVRTKYCSIKCRGIGRRKPESEKKVYIPIPQKIKYCGICGTGFI